MSSAEHLIENAIYAMAAGRNPHDEMKSEYNLAMLKETGIREEDVVGMAGHVVYSLYDGVFPDFPLLSRKEG